MSKIDELTGMFGSFDIGIGAIGNALLIFFLAVLIIGLGAVGIAMWLNNKKYKHKIPLYKNIGNRTVRVAIYKAKDFKIGNAGDKLWFVRGVKKYIPPATLQNAPNEYVHFEREDGEWINISMPDIDADMKKMGVKYVHQDMRANRIAISNILEQRFTNKSFWDKYGDMIVHLIFYIIVTISLVVIFYQWSDIVEKTSTLLDKIIALEDQRTPKGAGSLVPALMPLMFWRKKK